MLSLRGQPPPGAQVSVSFLGYREPSLVYLPRCQGRWAGGGAATLDTVIPHPQVPWALPGHLQGNPETLHDLHLLPHRGPGEDT